MNIKIQRLLQQLRPFHFGTVERGVPRPIGLWISSGYDLDQKKPYLNITLFRRFRGRIYAKSLGEVSVDNTFSPHGAVLACSCNTYWTQRDIDAYNDSDFERARSRHKQLWHPDGKNHDVKPIT